MTTQQSSRLGQYRVGATSAPQKPSRAKLLLPLALAVLALLLTACGWQGTGKVVGKELHEGYWYPTSYCAAYDSKGACTMTMQQQNYMPESYTVDVKDDAGEIHSVSVNKSFYESASDGDAFDNREEK